MNVTVRSAWWPSARRRSARGGVGLLWVLGSVLSYSALRELARMLGIADPLAYAFPLVIDVAVWVGSMNALEARDQGRPEVERYAWFLVALYALATIVGNVVVGATETLDPRLVHALGPDAARWAAEIAGSAPAVTMILFSHLAGLLMEGSPTPVPASTEDYDQVDVGETREVLAEGPTGAPAVLPASAAVAGLDHVRAQALTLPANTTDAPTDDRPRGGARTARKRTSGPVRGRARGQAPRMAAADVRALVEQAREHVLASSDRADDQALDDAIAEHLTTGGHRISASRVRTYLAELRRDAAPAPARRPRVLANSAAAPAAVAKEA